MNNSNTERQLKQVIASISPLDVEGYFSYSASPSPAMHKRKPSGSETSDFDADDEKDVSRTRKTSRPKKQQKQSPQEETFKTLIKEYGELDLTSNDAAFKEWKDSHRKKQGQVYSPSPIVFKRLDNEKANEDAFHRWLDKKDLGTAKRNALKKIYMKKMQKKAEEAKKLKEERKRQADEKFREWEIKKLQQLAGCVASEQKSETTTTKNKEIDKDAYNKWKEEKDRAGVIDPSNLFYKHPKEWVDSAIEKASPQTDAVKNAGEKLSDENGLRKVSFVTVLRDPSIAVDVVTKPLKPITKRKTKKDIEDASPSKEIAIDPEYRRKYPYLLSHLDI
jgi:hypothetical protein